MAGSLLRCRVILLCLAWLVLLLPAINGQAVPAGKALLTITLPAKAKLTVDEMATKQTGLERKFISPTLEPGHTYTYKLVATWDDKGDPKTVTRDVRVRPGQHVRVDLTKDEPTKQDETKKDEDKKDEMKDENKKDEKKDETKKDENKKGEDKKDDKKDENKKGAQTKNRTFLFTYSAIVTGLPAGKAARIWLPVPSSSPDQDVGIDAVEIQGTPRPPEWSKIADDPKSGNRYLYAEKKSNADGEIALAITYKITRREVKGSSKDTSTVAQLARYLQADALVPVEGKELALIEEKVKLPRDLPRDQTAAARVMYDLVNSHMKYGKPADKAWGRGDSVYAAEECVGNCSDFHSLFISLVRSRKIPAKFEVGFPLPPERGAGEIPGCHCWAKFKPEGGDWVPVDISEANKAPKMADYYFGNLTEDRVAFSTGRDLELVPKQDGPPVNYLIYPYVEVDGKAYPSDKVKRTFTYKDLP